MTPLQGPFQIAGFSVDPARNAVAGPDGETAIEPKVMDLLCVLAAAPGRVFSRGELIDLVWGTAFGADESLTRAISQLRKVLGDSREEPRMVETIPKRGYRLIAPVTPLAQSAPAATAVTLKPGRYVWTGGVVVAILAAAIFWWTSARVAPPRAVTKRVAVADEGATVTIASFTTEDPANRLLAHRLREGLVTDISRDSLIHVRARPADSGDFRYAVEGAIESVDGHVRVNVRLIDQASGNNLWADNFDRTDHGPGMEDALTAAVAAELEPRLLAAVKTELARKPILSLKPWQLNLLATWIPGTDQVFLAPHTPDAFWPQRRALALQPGYAPAHATLAGGLAYHALFSPVENTLAKREEARRHAEAAVAGAPFDPQVLYEIATYYRLIGDRANAALMLRRVLEISPANIEARIDLPFVQGQCNGASAGAIAALEGIGQGLLPDNPIRRVLLSHLADLYLARGEYDKARDAATRSRAVVPSVWSGITLAAADAERGRPQEARAVAAETKLEWPGLDFGQFADRLIGIWCLEGPKRDAARAAFQKLAAQEQKATQTTP